MNNSKIKGFVGFGCIVAGLALLGTVLAPVHAPAVAATEPIVVQLPEQTIVGSTVVVTEGPGEYRPVAAKAHRGAARKTAKLDIQHIPGLRGETVNEIHAPKHEPMTFDVDVQL
jgi:hypothetical protein